MTKKQGQPLVHAELHQHVAEADREEVETHP
jgi:hypothetical protein